MTKTIKTSIAAAVAMFALSGIAHAEGVKINLIGKDSKTVHAEIVQAARQVCRNADAETLASTSESECVSATIAKADEQLNSAQMRMARADVASAPQH